MADTGVVTKQLEIAGYGDIEFERVDAEVLVGKDLEDAVAFQLDLGLPHEVDEAHAAVSQALGMRASSVGLARYAGIC